MTDTAILLIIAVALGGLWYAAGHIRRPDTSWEAVLALPGDLRAAGNTPEQPPWRNAPAATGHRHPIPTTQPRCPNCQGRRCRAHREGNECRYEGVTEPTAYAAGHPLPRDGRHSPAIAMVRWLAGPGWETGELPIVRRVELGRLVGAARVPMLAGPARRLP